MPAAMIVMKFGGTSLGSAKNIHNVYEIVRASLDRGGARDLVVIVSAHSGVTNMLVEIGRRAPHGAVDIAPVIARHVEILEGLDLPRDLCDPLLAELKDLVRGMRLVGEASPRALDYLLSFGERCSARTVAACFSARGTPARAFDAGDVGLRTDSRFGRARPLPDDGQIARSLSECAELPIVTGFIAQDGHGNITTLGRNGSDFSAALFGNALSAREIQIWTDVDGIMTADPRIVPSARRIDAMSFSEASEVAYYGGRVLHPATILPAMEKSIPVRVLNTHRPESPGTLILPDTAETEGTVRAIVHKEGIHLINVVNPRMLQQPGYLARVFGLAAEHSIDVGLVATSEVSITMTTDHPGDLRPFLDELGTVGETSIESDRALLGVVGRGIARATGVASEVLATLAEHEIRVRVISQGALKVNVGLVIRAEDVARAVGALHARFFTS